MCLPGDKPAVFQDFEQEIQRPSCQCEGNDTALNTVRVAEHVERTWQCVSGNDALAGGVPPPDAPLRCNGAARTCLVEDAVSTEGVGEGAQRQSWIFELRPDERDEIAEDLPRRAAGSRWGGTTQAIGTRSSITMAEGGASSNNADGLDAERCNATWTLLGPSAPGRLSGQAWRSLWWNF